MQLPQDCLDVLYSFWSPSKEIKHRVRLNSGFVSVLWACHSMSQQTVEYYMHDVSILEPDTFREWRKKAQYEQFIRMFFSLREAEGMTWKDALDEVKHDTMWYI